MASLSAFESRLGHVFGQAKLLERALRHASLDVEEDNEQLEFLGDRVLGLVIAEYLLDTHGRESEGDMARRLAQLVSRKTCAKVAREIDLIEVLRMDEGIQKSQNVPTNILADACEAVLGAVYLDGGLAAAKRVIEAHWQPHFAGQTEAPIDKKTALQEWLMQRGLALPIYEIIERTGPDHAPEFTLQASAHDGSALGVGSSRKLAEQRAAMALLESLKQGAALSPEEETGV